MLIGRPSIQPSSRHVTWGVSVRFNDGTQDFLWFRVPQAYGDMLTERSDPALVALLLPAMLGGEDIHAEGECSPDLLHQLRSDLMHVLHRLLPEHREIVITSGSTGQMVGPAAGVATGFSAGVDSFSTLVDHYYAEDLPGGTGITHLLYTNVGSHGKRGAVKFRERLERLRPTARAIGLPLIEVDSNLDSFITTSFKRTHTLRNAAVALLLQRGIGRFYYSAAYSYDGTAIRADAPIAAADPIVLPLLSHASLSLRSSGSRHRRVDKIARVAEITTSHDTLDVCVSEGITTRNCSRCSKCLRTLLTLEICGALERYEAAFDLDLYRANRRSFIAHELSSRNPHARENVMFAREHNFAVPTTCRLAAPGLQLGALGARSVRWARRHVVGGG